MCTLGVKKMKFLGTEHCKIDGTASLGCREKYWWWGWWGGGSGKVTT
jgi:hypothetical protein